MKGKCEERKIFGPTKETGGKSRIIKKRWIRRINKTEEYNKSRKRRTIKLFWPFTSNPGRENGKKKHIMETDVNTNTRETKEQMGR